MRREKLIAEFKDTDLAMPEGLSSLGQDAWALIVEELKRQGNTDTGGCTAFKHPTNDSDHYEYGANSELLVIYDGGCVGYAFEYDNQEYEQMESMVEVLKPIGVYSESQTCWYSAIYKI